MLGYPFKVLIDTGTIIALESLLCAFKQAYTARQQEGDLVKFGIGQPVMVKNLVCLPDVVRMPANHT